MKRDGRFRKDGAAADLSFNQVSAGDGTGEIGALGEIRRRGFIRSEAELERNRVFAQNIRQTFQLAIRRGEERDSKPLLDHGAGFGHGDLHAAVKRHGRARADVRRLRIQIEVAHVELRKSGKARFQIFPVEEIRRGQFGGVLLVQALPETLGCAGDLLRLIEHDDGVAGQIDQRLLAGIFESRGKLPPWKERALARLFGQGKNPAFGHLHHGALRIHVEAADGFDLIAEEFDA